MIPEGGCRRHRVVPTAALSPLQDPLNEAAFYFQKEIGRKLQLKFTPRIKFVRDDSFDEAQKINALLKDHGQA